ncbi:MAG: hypothetical protein M3131_07945 [Actinomycetota bacterium]|nr:hypothetical protein [Actinomycetota bacterium]
MGVGLGRRFALTPPVSGWVAVPSRSPPPLLFRFGFLTGARLPPPGACGAPAPGFGATPSGATGGGAGVVVGGLFSTTPGIWIFESGVPAGTSTVTVMSSPFASLTVI